MTIRRRDLLTLLAAVAQGKDVPEYLKGFSEPWTLEAARQTKKVYTIEAGRPVIFLHELPGLMPEAFAFARRLNSAGYTVHLPLMFGQAGDNSNLRVVMQTPCWGAAFDCHQRHSLGRVVDWIAELCLEIDHRHKGSGVAVIGNCLTGAVPLALAARDDVRSVLRCVVIAQPTTPFGTFGQPKSVESQEAIGLTDVELARAVDSRVPALAVKFKHDPYVPEKRMQMLQRVFAGKPFRYEAFDHDEKCTSPARSNSKGHRHAVLTLAYCDDPDSNGRKAYLAVQEFLLMHLPPK